MDLTSGTIEVGDFPLLPKALEVQTWKDEAGQTGRVSLFLPIKLQPINATPGDMESFLPVYVHRTVCRGSCLAFRNWYTQSWWSVQKLMDVLEWHRARTSNVLPKKEMQPLITWEAERQKSIVDLMSIKNFFNKSQLLLTVFTWVVFIYLLSIHIGCPKFVLFYVRKQNFNAAKMLATDALESLVSYSRYLRRR